MSGFQRGHTQEQSTFDNDSAAGFVTTFSTEFETENEERPEVARNPTLSQDVLAIAAINTSTRTATIWQDSKNDTDALTEHELQKINDAIEKDLDPDQEASALVLWRDLRVVSRKTKIFAEIMLGDTEEGFVTSNPFTRTVRPPRESTSNTVYDNDYRSENKGASSSSRENIPSAVPNMTDSRSVPDGAVTPQVRLSELTPQKPVLVSPQSLPASKSAPTQGLIRQLSELRIFTLSQELMGHSERVELLAFSPDGCRLASAGNGDKTIRIWADR